MCRFLLLIIILHVSYVRIVDCDSGESESESGSGDEETSEGGNEEKEEKMSFSDIINVSVSHMVNSSDAKKKGELLNLYFFTVKKEDSIWPKALKETETTTNVEFGERELADMENAVKKIYRRILECNLNNAGQKKNKNKARDLVKCYKTLEEFIEEGFIDFGFPRGNLKGQTHMLEMNMAYNVMILLLYNMLLGMEQMATKTNSYKTELEFYNLAESFVSAVETASSNSVDVRLESITPIEICNIQEAMWIEFPTQCGTRVKRDISVVRGIGGTSDLFKQKYRATVKDEVTGKDVCFLEKTTDEKKDSNTIKGELRSECNKIRDVYVKQIREEISRYYEQISSPITEDLPKLWDSSDKKLSELKEKLEQKQRDNISASKGR